MIKELLMIFTRNPEYGKVKSRLAKQSSNEIALSIYKDLLKHTYEITCELKMDKWLFYSDHIEYDDIWVEGNFCKKIQSTGNLGDKMYNAFKQGFEANYTHIIIIGCDIEELNPDIITQAFNELNKQTVIGPAADGGYYLLGLNSMRKDIFENKKWGTNTVLTDTLTHFNNKDVFLLPTLNDIDLLEDIRTDSKLNKHLKFKNYATK